MSARPGRKPPPAEHRFKPGQSANPKGRPKGSKNKKPKMRTPALDETRNVPVNGVKRRMKLRDEIMLYAQQRAIRQNDQRLMSQLLDGERRLSEAQARIDYDSVFAFQGHGPSGELKNVEAIVRGLRMGRLMYKNHPAQRVEMIPYLVSMALARFKDHRLSREEQKLVVGFPSTPGKIAFPDWWEDDCKRKCRLPQWYIDRDKVEWALACTDPATGVRQGFH